jgi:hypothetical protein
MRAPYRTFPGPNNTILFYPLIRVRVGRKHGPTTRFFEAMVDSGATDCMFPADVATAVGITDIRKGKKDERNGIGGTQDVWLHPVILYIGEHALNIEAAFCDTLPVGGLLGRRGFFEYFKITFDPTTDPPGLDLERIHKA